MVIAYSTTILATIIILATSNQKVRHRCPISTTSILKMIRSFRLIEIRYSTNETLQQMCNTIFDDVIHRYLSSWRCCFNIWNTWMRHNTKKTWAGWGRPAMWAVTRYVSRGYVSGEPWLCEPWLCEPWLCEPCWMKRIESKRSSFTESPKVKIEKTVVRSRSANK